MQVMNLVTKSSIPVTADSVKVNTHRRAAVQYNTHILQEKLAEAPTLDDTNAWDLEAFQTWFIEVQCRVGAGTEGGR